jgi:hypothetical protein
VPLEMTGIVIHGESVWIPRSHFLSPKRAKRKCRGMTLTWIPFNLLRLLRRLLW